MVLNKKSLYVILSNLKEYSLRPLYLWGIKIPKPIQVSFAINTCCNAKCKYCEYWKERGKSKIRSFKKHKQIISQLKSQLGTFKLFFSDREPTLSKELPELIKYASKKNLFTAINTNLLIKKKQLVKIIDSNPDMINVSIDSINKERYDLIRGTKNGLKRLMENLNILKKSKINTKIRISTIILQYNLKELKKIVQWVQEENFYDIIFHPLFPNMGIHNPWMLKNFKQNPLWPQNFHYVRIKINQLIQMKKEGYKIANSKKHLELMKEYFKNPLSQVPIICLAYRSVVIDSQGQLRICRYDTKPLGNLFKEDFNTIWKKNSKKILSKIKGCKRPCAILSCNTNPSLIEDCKKAIRLLFK